jgi:hypothetical protein
MPPQPSGIGHGTIFLKDAARMDTDFIETLQRGIAIVGGIGLLGFCLYLLKTHKGA